VDSIVVHLPDALKALVPVVEDAVAWTAAAVAQARSDGPFDMPCWERVCTALGAAVERTLTATVLAALARDEPRLWIGGQPHRPVGTHAATFYTLRGPVVIERTLYRPLSDRHARAVDPVALRAGTVRATWLPHVAASMAFLVQQGPARDATQTASQLGVLPYGHTSFEAVTHAVGALYRADAERVEEALVRTFTVPATATGLVASLDRVATPMEEPRKRPRGRPKKKAPKRPVTRAWRMAYCATVSLHDKDGRTLHTIRYGCMPDEDVEAVVDGMRDDLKALLRQAPTLKVTALCDGAREMWNLLGEGVSDAQVGRVVQRLVDLWHLLQKLGKALRVRYDAQRAAAELRRWKLRLLNTDGVWQTLLEEIERWGLERVTATPEADAEEDRCPVHAAITFLRNQGEAGRLDYARARREGRPVGSGVVEATCKSLFNVRFKRSGARWKSRTGGHVVRLRALVLSQRYTLAMELLLPALRHDVRRAA
jgi:hypothetical protein